MPRMLRGSIKQGCLCLVFGGKFIWQTDNKRLIRWLCDHGYYSIERSYDHITDITTIEARQWQVSS